MALTLFLPSLCAAHLLLYRLFGHVVDGAVFRFAQAAKQAEEEAMPKREEPPEPIDKVPDGFELVEMNGRKILRMK